MAGVIVEDGSIVPSANSFVTRDDVTLYTTARGLAGWTVTDPNAADAAVLRGADYIKNEVRYLYRGSRIDVTQSMPWPRLGASEYRGPVIPSNYISWRLKDAQCELAYREFLIPGSIQPDLERGGYIKDVSVGTVKVTYMDNASPETVLAVVAGLLEPLLMQPPKMQPIPQQQMPVDPPAFTSGAFDNPAANTLFPAEPDGL